MWREKLKKVINKKCNCRNVNMSSKLTNEEMGKIMVVPGIWRENWQMRKMRNAHSRTWNMASNAEKHVKWETHTVNLKYGEKEWKTWNRKNIHNRTWILKRKLTNVENETQTLYDLEYDEKRWKTWKMRNGHCSKWDMARNLKNVENEKHKL